VAVTLLAGAAVLAAFLAVVSMADGGDLRAVMRRGASLLGRSPEGPPRVGA
jgi:hypothetical protein